MSRLIHRIFLLLLIGFYIAELFAAEPQYDDSLTVTSNGKTNTVIGGIDSASEGVVSSTQIESQGQLRPADVLEFIPGVVVTQHSGDGKANQYFLRGFNLDHGTDFLTRIEGMPVNLPSNAHGQGYMDLNFLIPEIIGQIDYRKGPYYADTGDFSSAGSANFFYKSKLATNFGLATVGSNMDFLLHNERSHKGTRVVMRIALNSERTLRAVFDSFSGTEDEDYAFNKTIVPGKLALYEGGQLISRSQGKRILNRVDRFKRVLLDFKGVESIGQAFADEVFRVFVKQNPQITIHSVNDSLEVRKMIKAAQSGNN